MIGLTSFGLIVIALQRVTISAMRPMPQNPNRSSMIDMMHAIQGVAFIYFPIMIVGGIIFGVAGFHVLRGSLAARRIAQANAICGYIWIIAYSYSCYQAMDANGPTPHWMSESASTILQWFSIVVSALMFAAFPTALLYILSRPQNQSAKTLPEPAKQI